MRWRDRTILAAVIAVVMLSLVGGCGAPTEPSAGPYEDAIAAYTRGDYTRAYRLIHPLAEQGVALAQTDLGTMYSFGHGVPQDYAASARWYRKAAEQGVTSAQLSLGLMYRAGRGVTRDNVEAHKWFIIADAANARENFAREVTPSQLAEAQRRAREWRPRQRVAATSPSTVGPRTKYQPAQPDAEDTSNKRRRIARIQRRLASLGYDPGPVDGVLDRRTRAAIRELQDREGLPVTGIISDDLEAALRSASRAVATAPSPASRPLAKTSTGSGFYVSDQGHVLTNEHVVDECVEVRIAPSLAATVVARDQASDLALLKGRTGRVWAFAAFRRGRGIRPGDDIIVMGYPLPSLLASEAHVTTGTVSALAGPGDDRRFIQITAPVQPGNSGGPVLDTTGNIVGVVMAKLNAIKIARVTGDIPQNVNFAIGAGTARAFLDAQSVPYEVAPSTDELKTADVAAEARRFTVLVECWN